MASALRRKETFTICVPIPSFIPRQLAIKVLHNHSDVIKVNPLVLSHKQTLPPRDAPADEYAALWYEITERIQYIPGIGKMGSGKITFNGCFYDVPWGLQTHTYAPMNVDMRAQYTIDGNAPGEMRQFRRELGLDKVGAPTEGLYLRADVSFECNITLASFVRSQAKAAIRDMVDMIIRKAEVLEANALAAMFEQDKKTPIERPPAATFPVELPNDSVNPQTSPSIYSQPEVDSYR